jgi:hypothetical protein
MNITCADTCARLKKEDLFKSTTEMRILFDGEEIPPTGFLLEPVPVSADEKMFTAICYRTYLFRGQTKRTAYR